MNLNKKQISKFRYRFEKKISWLLKDGLKSLWWFFCPGSGSAFSTFCSSGFAYDQCWSTSLFKISFQPCKYREGDVHCTLTIIKLYLDKWLEGMFCCNWRLSITECCMYQRRVVIKYARITSTEQSFKC